MKILKPGKVEQRRFVCPDCESVLVIGRCEEAICPVCRECLSWSDGEPYEEPVQDTQSHRERLADLIAAAPVQRSAPRDEKRLQIADYMIANGVTFKEE